MPGGTTTGTAVVVRMARRSATRRAGRIAATVAGVSLATAFCVAAFGVAAQLERLVSSTQTAADRIGLPAGSVVVTSRTGSATEPTAISGELVDRIAALDGVLSAQGSFDQPIAVRLPGGSQRDRPPILRGLVFTSAWDATRWRLIDGSAPGAFSGDPREPIGVALDAGGLVTAQAQVGDELRLQTPTGGWRAVVVGEVTSEVRRPEQTTSADTPIALTSALADAHIVISPDILPVLLGAQGRVDRITVVPRPGVTPATLSSALRQALPAGLRIVAADDPAALRSQAVATISDGITAATWGFALLAALVAAIIVSNTFAIVVSQRTAEIALARCIGMSRRQSFAVFVGEALLVGGIAAAIGLAAGVPLSVLAARTLRPGTTVDVLVTPAMVAAAAAVGLGVTVVAAVRPAVRASRVSPLEALRVATSRRRRRGVVLVAISPLLALLRRSVAWSTTAKMSLDNATRDPRRASATVSTLFIGIGLTAAVLTASATVRQAIDDQYRNSSTSDLYIQRRGVVRIDATSLERRFGGPGPLDGYLDVTAVDGVLGGPRGSVGAVTAASPDATFEQFDLDPISPLPATVAGGAFLSDDTAAALGVTAGGSVTLRSTSGTEAPLRVLGVYRRTGFFGPAVVDRAIAAAAQADGTFEAAAISLPPGAPIDRIRRYIDGQLRGFNSVSVDTPAAFAARDTDIATTVTRLILVLLVGAVFLGALGTANSVSLSVLERRRELAMLRAVGAGRSQVRSIISGENMALCGVAGLLATLTGAIVGAVGATFAPTQFTGRLVIPWALLTILALATTAIGWAAAALPAQRAGRRDLLMDLDAL